MNMRVNAMGIVFHFTAASEETIFFTFNVRRFFLNQIFVVESLNVLEGGITTNLGHQPDF